MSKDNTNLPFTDEEYDEEMQEAYDKQLRTSTLMEENKTIQAELTNTKLKMQKREIDRIGKIQDKLVNTDLSKRKFNKRQMHKDVEDRRNAVTFFNKKTSKHIFAAPSSLIVIPSMTNNGKSTLTAALAETLVNEGKRVLLLSNEEKETDARARVSCLRKKVSFGDYKTDQCTQEEYNSVIEDAEMLADKGLLVVVATTDETDAYMVTTVTGVMQTLEAAKGKFDAVMLDYYTNVNMSEMGTIEPWHVNNRLAGELNIFKDTAPFPIIVMAQCESIRSDKKIEDKGALDFDGNHPMYRWKGGKSILTFATDIVELVKDFENSRSFLWLHKVRFSHGELQRLHSLPFDKKMQRFVEWSAEYDAGVTASKVTRTSQDQGKKLGLGNVFDKDRA